LNIFPAPKIEDETGGNQNERENGGFVAGEKIYHDFTLAKRTRKS
jgi:hypothetical protein